jgi:hypothetical protein
VVYCQRGGDFSVDFVEYKQAGERFPPDDKSDFRHGGKVTEFKSVPLVGNVEVELTYFTDPECRVPKRFSKLVTLTP